MYNLNYTYLTDLEVDTRQTFADISDDLLLLGHDDTLEKASAKSLVSSWQNFFWESKNPNKKNINIIFTDLSVQHTDPSSDYTGAKLEDSEMITVGELSSFFNKMDETASWCKTPDSDGYTFDGLVSELSSAINILHRNMLNNFNIYPKGSIVLSNDNPVAGRGFGQWEEKPSAYLSENVSNMSEISMGFNSGKVEGKSVGSNLKNVVVKPTYNGTPKHTHKITFVPESGSGGNVEEETEQATAKTYTNVRAGKRKTPGQSYSGQITDAGWHNNSGLVVATDASSPREAGNRKSPTFSVSKTKVDPGLDSINVAPKTYPIDAKLWERIG